MATYFAKRAVEILREDGPIELCKTSTNFILRNALPDEVWRQYVRAWVWVKYGCHYHTPIDPFRVLWVDPNEIIYRQSPKPAGGTARKHYAIVLDGNWDQNLPCFDEYYIYQFIRDRYHRGVEPENTDFFAIFQKRITKQEKFWNGCCSVEDFHKRSEYLDDLFNNIRKNGIKTTEQLGAKAQRRNGFPDNIHINIGRNGELIYLSGRHRLSIAKVLDIEAIPVNVMIRHASWQELRDEIHNNGLPKGREDLRDHPDLQDVL